MVTFITLSIFFCSSILGKFIFKRWINPLFLYTSAWSFMITLYEMKLISYSQVSNSTWLIILLVYIMFFLGVITFYIAKSVYGRNEINLEIERSIEMKLFSDGGKYVKNLILFFGIIGFLVALQHWYVLLNEFGGIGGVLIGADDVYRMRIEGENFGKIPYLTSFSYIGVFLAALYSAYKNKFSILVIIPILGVILSDAANFARAGVFFAFLLFIITFIMVKYYMSIYHSEKSKRGNKKFIITAFVIILITFSSVYVIRFFRNPVGDIERIGARNMHNFRGDLVIMQSMYLYFSSPVVVLEEYFHYANENVRFGENTFYPFYNFIKRFKVIEKLEAYPHGYFIPMWSNSSTFIRELHADFGFGGVIIFPFLIGFASSYYWFNFFTRGKISSLILLTFIEIIIVFSVFNIATRHVRWYIGVVGLLIVTKSNLFTKNQTD